jgi:ATP-dependent helicase HrpA
VTDPLDDLLVPTISYPPDLPITERRDELLEVIGRAQVVIVAGETGSGKSTQLPKLCLELGRGQQGWIGHTQPRRIAARSIAERVAEELDTSVGGMVGYTVRFNDRVSPATRIKLMTDGILLAEIQRDRSLRRYDTLILDEAHERSLNIDFLLGYLHQLLPRRPDLKVIITSATIDTERFSQHFGDAPVVEVSGRTYPVEVRYQPLDDPERDEVLDQTEGICRAVQELRREGHGDVLVFCSGEREIRDAAQALRGLRLTDTEILPLYARLSAAEQHRVFEPHPGRRVVLATNVAETSLTVPGIRYVVDPGTARISRYSHRTKVQRLPIEPISQASADQRAGRCGRIGPGVCIRLFGEDDYEARPLFTEPEIQRTNLASVILQMGALGLGRVEDFPFVDPPDTRAIRDGIALLVELGAVDPEHEGTRRWLTPIGRQLATLPVDPRLGRMVLAASGNGCLHEVMIIAAALSIQDPRERPTGPDQGTAAALHARFEVPGSDLLSYIRLWDHLTEIRRDRSSNQFRKLCRAEFLHVLRIREWQDLYAQLRQVAARMGMRPNREPAPPEAVHRSLLPGLLSHVGMHTGTARDYRGARNSRFTLARDALRGSTPRWVMAAELVETTRVWAHAVAGVRPEWIEEAADHLVTRSYGEPWWDASRGTARTTERVALYGLSLVADRDVELDRIDPVAARRLFIEHALVDGEWDRRHRFIAHNAEQMAEVDALSARARRDLAATPDRLGDFFDERIPDHVVSARHFDRWWSRRRQRDPHLLDIPLAVALDPGAGTVDRTDFPDEWNQGGLTIPLTYVFDPDGPVDGVVAEVPVSVLAQLRAEDFIWQVPGLRSELVDALLRGLPKTIRRRLVPIPDTVADLVDELDPAVGDLVTQLRDELSVRTGERVRRSDLDLTRVPRHLRITFRVHDDDGSVLAVGTDLDAVRHELGATVRAALSELDVGVEREALTDWPGGALPRVVHASTAAGHRIQAYPALVDEGATVAVRLLPSRAEQAEAMWAGTRRLLRLRLPAAARALGRLPTDRVRTMLATSPYHDEHDWLDDLLTAVFDHLIDEGEGPAWDAEAFEALRVSVRDGLSDALRDAWSAATEVLAHHHAIAVGLAALTGPGFAEAVADITEQRDRLVYRGMITAVGVDRLPHIARYLQAIERRLEKMPDDPARDRQRMARCRRLEADYDRLRANVPWSPALEEVGWLLEEFRVATFAQQLGTAQPVSEKRLWSAMGQLDPG